MFPKYFTSKTKLFIIILLIDVVFRNVGFMMYFVYFSQLKWNQQPYHHEMRSVMNR